MVQKPPFVRATRSPRPALALAMVMSAVAILSATIWLMVRPSVARVVTPAQPSWPKPVEARPEGPAAPMSLTAQIRSLGSGFDGKVGIAVRSVEQDWTASWFGGGRFPQQSVSKMWVAATVMDQVDAGRIRLSDPVTVTNADLTVFHQPIRSRIGPDGYATTIEELLFLAMTQSDNTANDILFRRVGGQAGVRDFLARRGVDGIAISTGEKDLQSATAGIPWDPSYSYGQAFWIARGKAPPAKRAAALTGYVANPVDGATPFAIAKALARLKRGGLLSLSSTAKLLELMDLSTTGPKRLRGGLAPGWTLAHKTGTGQVMGRYTSAYNDVGLLSGPNGRSFSLVVMIGATYRTVPQRQALMQAVTRAVIDCVNSGAC